MALVVWKQLEVCGKDVDKTQVRGVALQVNPKEQKLCSHHQQLIPRPGGEGMRYDINAKFFLNPKCLLLRKSGHITSATDHRLIGAHAAGDARLWRYTTGVSTRTTEVRCQ